MRTRRLDGNRAVMEDVHWYASKILKILEECIWPEIVMWDYERTLDHSSEASIYC